MFLFHCIITKIWVVINITLLLEQAKQSEKSLAFMSFSLGANDKPGIYYILGCAQYNERQAYCIVRNNVFTQ